MSAGLLILTTVFGRASMHRRCRPASVAGSSRGPAVDNQPLCALWTAG
jgi:hypothetical protein